MITFIKSFLVREEVKDIVKLIAPTLYHRFKAWINKQLTKLDKSIETKWEDYAWGAMDSTDSRDIRFSDIASDEELTIELPRSFVLDNWFTSNQWPTNLCVAFGSAEGRDEGADFYDLPLEELHIETADYIEANLDSKIRERGTYIVNWPKALKAMGKIHSYFQTDTLWEIKRAIYLGCPVQSGTNKASWSKTAKNAVVVNEAGWGHHMNIVWFDDDMTRADGFWNVYTGFLIIENTWWARWWDKWRYYLPYQLVDTILFNTKKGIIVDATKVSERAQNLVNNIENEINKIEDKWNNRYFHLIKDKIKNWYTPIFNDLFEDTTLNAWEIKTLIEISNIRKNGN